MTSHAPTIDLSTIFNIRTNRTDTLIIVRGRLVVCNTQKPGKIMSKTDGQLFLPRTSKTTLPKSVTLPNLLEPFPKTKATRPRSECCFDAKRRSYGLPDLNKQDSNFILPGVKRPQSIDKRPRTAQSLTVNSKPSQEKHPVVTSAELSIYKLSKYNKHLIKPEIKIRNVCTNTKALSEPSVTNKKLLDEHIAKENEHFDKHESKRSELLRWLQNSGKD